MEKVIERMWLPVSWELGPGNGRLLILSSVLGMDVLLRMPVLAAIFKDSALREHVLLRPSGLHAVTEPSYPVKTSV